ncbi:hypothetical protein AB0G04_20570 [Actinoplanes sp. NPDC023801]|uniref:hypothetical protein n=1 Tax=Actinoplanes sp. NPDC023801 TaxID=3154595 RepID=UPI0033DF7172
MTENFVVAPPCGTCGKRERRIELVPPGGLPLDWDTWPDSSRALVQQRRGDGWWMVFSGIEGGNGHGDPLTTERAERIRAAFAEPYQHARVRTADFYDDAGMCGPCGQFYCEVHWNPTVSGLGRCPGGHTKSLNPFWTSAFDD